MRRTDFGAWGAELSSEDFARALAALGVLWAGESGFTGEDPRALAYQLVEAASVRPPEEPVRWTMALPPEHLLANPGIMAAPLPSAAALAAAWRLFLPMILPRRPRLEIRGDGPRDVGYDPARSLPWLASELSRPAVGASAVYVRVDEPATEVGWRWPMRVGFLRDTRSLALRDRIAERMGPVIWLPRLVSIVDAEGADGECDILIVPMDLRHALAAVAGAPRRVTADCVAVLGRTEGPPEVWYPLAHALRAAASTSGVVLQHVSTEDDADWFVRLIEWIAHNEAIDEAVFGVRPNDEPPPFIAASGELVIFRRLSHRIDALGQRLESPRRRGRVVPPGRGPGPLPPVLPKGAGTSVGGATFGQIGRWLQEVAANASRMGDLFRHETDAAGAAAEAAEAAASTPPPPPPQAGPSPVPAPAPAPDAAWPPEAEMAAPAPPDSGAVPPDPDDYPLETASPGPPVEEETEPESRFIRAKVLESADAAGGMGIPREHAWRPEATHEIRISIGALAPEEGWVSMPSHAPFPTHLLPRQPLGHDLTVVMTEMALLDEPLVGSLHLPYRGDSTECRFHLYIRPGVREVRARIIVLFRNRVLQTAILSGPVSDADVPVVLSRIAEAGDDAEGVTGDAWAGGTGGNDGSPEATDPGEATGSSDPLEIPGPETHSITLEPETIVRASLDELERRTPFAAALVLNHSATGEAGITALADGSARAFHISPDLAREIAWFDGRLTEVALDRASYADGLDGEETVALLRAFARHGELLYKHIVRAGIGDGALARGGPIQIVSAVAGSRLPAEFIYDRRAPRETASLCPNAAESLRAGECPAECPGRAAERDHVCPLGFWGLSRVIERHSDERRMRRPDLAALVDVKPHAFLVEPIEGRDSLRISRGGIVAGSQRVEKAVPGGLSEIAEELAAGLQVIDPITDWESWSQTINDHLPTLLVMIVHTDLSDDELEKMEIGDGSWLTVVDMDEDYITPDPAAPPIVLLLGCETGAPGVGFAGFVSRCLEYGAAVVVAAGAKIHSAHAVPVARAFVDALHRESAAGTGPALGAASMRSAATFGEVMRRVKCDLLAEGLPMVLTLTAHGDADWRLVSEEITITEPAPATDPDSPVADPHSPSPEPPAP